MIRTPTVIILGAGASMPYRFPSGEGLLALAKGCKLDALKKAIHPQPPSLAPALQRALLGTLHTSIDAMLETLPQDVINAGKSYMARHLLGCESQERLTPSVGAGRWHEYLWRAFNLSSLEAFANTPVTLVTYNYDRLLEHALVRALSVQFPADYQTCYSALKLLGPIHLHGQLGAMPSRAKSNVRNTVPFGGSTKHEGATDNDVELATQNIKIVHEPSPQDDSFKQAREALSKANRVVFLGFGYGTDNVQRLQLHDCLPKTAELFLCTKGITKEEQLAYVRPHFGPWNRDARYGDPDDDIVTFLRKHPEAFL